MLDIIKKKIEELENIKAIRENNGKMWTKQIYSGKLSNIKGTTSTIDLKCKERKKHSKIKYKPKRPS